MARHAIACAQPEAVFHAAAYKQVPVLETQLRDRINDATDFMGWYMSESSDKLGISRGDAEAQYLAYHEGRTGYANQSYLNKPWLVDVAAAIGRRSTMYAEQLSYCRR